MFNNYFNEYKGFTSISKGKLPPEFTMADIKFHGTENPHHYMGNFVMAITLKGIDKFIFHLIFPWTFDKDVMRWYNTIDP